LLAPLRADYCREIARDKAGAFGPRVKIRCNFWLRRLE
jgi:hypothetical protein